MSEAEVICSRRGAAGEILLNRPKSLNALTLGMVRAIAAALDAWETDPAIERILIRGAGDRAFCAGGDVRLLHDLGRAGDHAAQIAFWREEYVLNRRIHRYSKPFVALMDGIVMGGGVGLSIHGSHRIAGAKLAFAMPEVSIGFVPDVGATWFLPRLPDEVGAWLALTAGRLGAGDAVATGVAQHFVPPERWGEILEALCESGATDAIIGRFKAEPPAGKLDRSAIARAFRGTTMVDVVTDLETMAGEGSAFAADALATIRTKSPTSLAIALRQVRTGGAMEIEAALATELRLVAHVGRGHDFYEGVRAVLVDRDNRPAWSPVRIEDVTPAMIDAYFAALGADDLVFSEAR